MKWSIPFFLGAALAAAAAAAGADGYLVRVYYDGDAGRLAGTSFVPYWAGDEYAVGEVSAGYSRRLAARGFRVDVLAEDPAALNIWEVDLPATALPAAATVLLEIRPGLALVATPRDVLIEEGHRALRLRPRPVDFGALAAAPAPAPFAASDEIAEIVAAVNAGRYENGVRDLAAFGTRYSYSSKSKEAADYLEDELAGAGLHVERDRYIGAALTHVAAASPAVCWAAGEEGVVARTTDGGASWRVLGPVTADDVEDVACASADVAWLASRDGSVWRTEDGGAHWTETKLDRGDVKGLFFRTAARGWAVTNEGVVFATTDGGDTWQERADVGAWLRGVAFADAQRGLICGHDGYLARTEDGGRTWTRVGTPPPFRLTGVAYRTAAEAYVTGEGGTCLRTADGGATWHRVDLGTEEWLQDTAFKNGQGFITGGVGRLWRSADGVHWSSRGAPKYILYSVTPASPGELWLGASGGALLFSDDGGASWKDQAKSADAASPYVWDNVWARREGRGGVAGATVFCAHYDSYAHASKPETPDAAAPGADDNATGAAAVVEFARAARGHDFRGDVVFALYSGEEQGLRGSEHFVPVLAGSGEPVRGAINLDMVGYGDALPEDADLVTHRGDYWLMEFGRRASATYNPPLGFHLNIDAGWRSDHASFFYFGYPAYLMIEDWPPVYPYYHTAQDTPDKLDFELAVSMTRGAVAAAAALAVPASTPTAALDDVQVYPNPYKVGKHHGRVFFVNLPPHSRVRFYNLAGERVAEGGNGAEPLWAWEVELKTPPIKSSGVYIYVIETADGQMKSGKLAFIR